MKFAPLSLNCSLRCKRFEFIEFTFPTIYLTYMQRHLYQVSLEKNNNKKSLWLKHWTGLRTFLRRIGQNTSVCDSGQTFNRSGSFRLRFRNNFAVVVISLAGWIVEQRQRSEPYKNGIHFCICWNMRMVAKIESVLLISKTKENAVLCGRHALGSMKFEVCFVWQIVVATRHTYRPEHQSKRRSWWKISIWIKKEKRSKHYLYSSVSARGRTHKKKVARQCDKVSSHNNKA